MVTTFTVLSNHRPFRWLFSEKRLYLQWLLDIYLSGLSHLAHIGMNWNTIKAKTKEPVMHLEVTTTRLSWYCTTSWWCVVVKCPFVFFSVTAHEIKVMTNKDSVLSNVLWFVPNGWPITAVTEELKPYYRRREKLSDFEGCILWGHQVVVPPQAQETILKVHHVGGLPWEYSNETIS